MGFEHEKNGNSILEKSFAIFHVYISTFHSIPLIKGAMDNGGGCALMWQSLMTIKSLGLSPKRTIRVVLFTAEEWGYLGSKEYYRANINDTVIFAAESDTGRLNFTGIPQRESIKVQLVNRT